MQPSLRGFLRSEACVAFAAEKLLENKSESKNASYALQAMRSLNFLKADEWLSIIFWVGEKNKGPIL